MDFVHESTGDESSFLLEHSHYDVLAMSRDDVPETPMTTIDTKTCTLFVIWSISAIHSQFALTNGMKSNSQYTYEYVIADIRQNVCSSSRRKTLEDILLHLYNASVPIRDFLQKRLNPQKLKERRTHLLVQTWHHVTSSSLVI
jgi:hypothetical protein